MKSEDKKIQVQFITRCNSHFWCVLMAGGFILCCVVTSALCLIHSVTASPSTCITNTVRSKKNNILCNDVTFTLLPEQPAAFE